MSSQNKLIKDIARVLSANLVVAIVGFLGSFIFPKILTIESFALYHTFTLYVGYIAITHLGFPSGMMINYAGQKYAKIDNSQYKAELTILFTVLAAFTAIFLGIAIGFVIGAGLAFYFAKVHIRDTQKVLIILSISFMLVVAEDSLATPITFSALIAVMFIGIGLRKKRENVAERLSVKYGKLWVAAEVFLFVLVGATVNIQYLGNVGIKALVVIIGALIFRMMGVFICLIKTNLKWRERLFTMMAYTPKATVQAAIGGIPLALGFDCGNTVLTVAVLAIVLTAPLGAFAIDFSYKKLLSCNKG